MKKISIPLLLVLLALCGCTGAQENTDTRLLLDTFVTLTADCDDGAIAAAFDECARYERIFSRTDKSSEASQLNRSEDELLPISEDTYTVLEKALWCSELTDGKFDITVCSVSELWDFENQIIPSRDEIAEALKNVDYQSIEINSSSACLHGKKIDLGGIAKGYIADRLAEYLQKNGAENGVANLGGDIKLFGNKAQDVKIQSPNGGYAAVISVSNCAVVTSGTYERHFERNGINYHHIIDPTTGYSAETDLASATVICSSALTGDALSTSCILLGKEKAAELIEDIDETEAVFIANNGGISYTSGIINNNNKLYIKNQVR